MMRILGLILLAGLLQDSDDPTLKFYRDLQKRHDDTRDAEVKARVGKVLKSMRNDARIALFGEPEEEGKLVSRLYDTRNLTSRSADQYSSDFWMSPNDEEGGDFWIDDGEREPLVTTDSLAELIQMRVDPDYWEEEDGGLELMPNNQLLVSTLPHIHRKITAFLRELEYETQIEVSISLWAFAFASPDAKEVAIREDGTVTDAAFRRLLESDTRRLGSVQLNAQADQVVSAFSGTKQRMISGYGDGGANTLSIPDGFCVEVRAVPGDGTVRTQIRLAYTKLLGQSELKTPKGPIQLPRLASVKLDEDREVPVDKVVLLGRLGPLPSEAKLPPYVHFFAKFTVSR